MSRLGQNGVHARLKGRDAVRALPSYVNRVERMLLNVFYPSFSSSQPNVSWRPLVPESWSMCKITEGRVDLILSSSKKFLDCDEKCRVTGYFGEFRPGATPSGWGLVKHKDSWTRVRWQKPVSKTAAVGVCHGRQLQVKRISLCNFAMCCECLCVIHISLLCTLVQKSRTS